MNRPRDCQRRLPIGAEPLDGGVHFRLWAPDHRRVQVVLEDQAGSELHSLDMRPEDEGFHALATEHAVPGSLYRFRLGDQTARYPDLASRYQPRGPEGPSQVIDPGRFAWTDSAWQGPELAGQVIYEMHIGTFTPEGTWQAAARQLKALAELGITLLEIMPLADWVGQFNWGYDGVSYFAPTRLYGEPDDLRAFVDKAHSLGIAVLIDIVYNHAGAPGNYFEKFSSHYNSQTHKTEWGAAFNFDGPHSRHVREFFLSNIRYWIDEFHVDGFRIDATQAYFDDSEDPILGEFTRAAREAARPRKVIVIAESEPQEIRMVRPAERNGFGMDALWNDDFHHAAMVRLTGRREAYYTDYGGSPEEFVAALKYGYLFQGQRYKWQKKRRGSAAIGTPAATFINYLQNHDQLANSAAGRRVHELTSPGRYRAMTALLLLGPGTPLLFQGQEFAARAPFLYFNDSPPELVESVAAGRAKFLKQFRSLALDVVQRRLPRPEDPDNFRACKLDFAEREKHREVYQLHADLIKLRRDDPAIAAQRADRLDGARIGPDALVVRYFGPVGDRLLLVNFGVDLHLDPAPQPLLAPEENCRWSVLWSSEDPRYGGTGTPELEGEENWRIPGEAAVLMQSVPFQGNPYAYSDT